MCVSGEFLTVESNASKSLHCRPQFSGNSRWSDRKKVSSSVRAVSKYSGCNPWLNEWVLSLVGSCRNHLLPTSPSHNLIMVPIVPSPAHRTLCAHFQSYSMRVGQKGPGLVFTAGSPQVPNPTTIWRPSWKSDWCLFKSTIWSIVWISSRKSDWWFGNNALFFLGTNFPTSTETAERDREHVVCKREVHPSCKWPFCDDLWLLVAIHAEEKDVWWTLDI